jgi:hypothetical protein
LLQFLRLQERFDYPHAQQRRLELGQTPFSYTLAISLHTRLWAFSDPSFAAIDGTSAFHSILPPDAFRWTSEEPRVLIRFHFWISDPDVQPSCASRPTIKVSAFIKDERYSFVLISHMSCARALGGREPVSPVPYA